MRPIQTSCSGWDEEGIRHAGQRDSIATTGSQYAVEKELVPGLIYAWRVEAYDADVEPLGLSDEHMFKLAGTPPARRNQDQKLRQEPP